MSLPAVRTTHFIGNEWIESSGLDTMSVVNPADGTELLTVPAGTADDVDAAVAAAARASVTWRRTPPAERAAHLGALAAAMEADIDTLVALESADAGKPRGNAEAEIRFAIDLIRFCAGGARCLQGSAAGEYVRGATSIVRREPLGVVAGITPWNYPVVMLAYKVGPALAAGNTTVLKPAEQTPLSTLRIAELAAGVLPPGVLNIVLGEGRTAGARLVTHPDVRLVSLTGDTDTGRAIARAAADSLKRVHLELGGKSPVIVFDDADLDRVVAGLRHGSFYNSGQDCTAASRVLAGERIYDELLERLVAATSTLRVGDPARADVDLGPVVSEAQRTRVLGFVSRAAQGGHAEVLAGGGSLEGAGFFVEPTVVAHVEQGDEIVQREVFGPVVTVQPFAGEDAAIEAANGTQYGLGASVWTTDVGRAMRVSGALEAGAVWVNCHDVITPEMPHGGVKASGYGKDLSMYSIEEYTHVKHVLIDHGEA